MKRFSEKDRQKFRKLLELAHSSSFKGERESALRAATRMADAHGMSLREAAGMPDDAPEAPAPKAKGDWDFGGGVRQKWSRASDKDRQRFAYDSHGMATEKRRYEEALADAIRRGLVLDDTPKKKESAYYRTPGGGAWRSRPEFVRVLLRETQMTAKEIAETVGVSIHDVFKEKLLMRKAS